MSKTFDIYTRVSEVGDRGGESFGSPEDQEASARRWAERERVEIGELVYEENVSGGLRPDDRELGRLIERCERGESGGIIIPWLDRLTRDVGHGGVVLDRITKAGARLVTSDGAFDSANLTPETRLVFHQLLSVGQYLREKNRAARLNGSRRAAARGVYLASVAPFGFLRKDVVEPQYRADGTLLRDGTLVDDPKRGPLVEPIFKQRADGWTARAIRDWLRDEHDVEVTAEGLRKIFKNRAYLGEARVPTGIKGQPEIVKNAHKRLVSDDLWERANAVGGRGRFRTTGRLSSQVRLAGLVYCGTCGRRLKTGGGARDGRPQYTCTHEGCTARSVIRAERLDVWVSNVLSDAFLAMEPHIVAIMEGDDRYQKALERVEKARLELDTYRAEIKVSDVGVEQWKRDVAIRQAALDLARAELKATPAPEPSKKFPVSEYTFEEAEPGLAREHNARFIARVVVKPVGRGRRVPPAERAEIWLMGAEEPLDPATVQPVGDPETDAILAAAHTPEALKAAAAHSAAEVAATEAAYEVAHTPEALRKLGGAAPVEKLAAEHRAKEGA